MPKIPKCKTCGESGHYAISCRQKPLKPAVKRSTSKVGNHIRQDAKKVVKKKKSSKTSAKEKAWKAFSDYIRLRDCLATTGTPDYCICITCNERGDNSHKPYKDIQAGHAVGGRSNAVLFHEEIVNGQCGYCNRKPPMGLGGDYGNYAIALIKRYGIEHVEELQRLKGSTLQYKTSDFIEIAEKYKQKRIDLLA